MRIQAFGATALVTALAAALAACGGGTPKPEKTVQQLMAQDVQPTAEVYWDAVKFVSDLENGDQEFFPKTDAEWEKVRLAAVTLGEHGKLLATPGYAEGRGKDWIEFSNGLVEVAKVAEAAAAAKDKDKVFEVGYTIYSVCSACHQAYPPAQGIPGATAEATPEA